MSTWRHFIPTFLLSVLLISSRVLAGEPSVGDLIKLAPVIQSSADKYQSIELGGYWKDDDGNVLLRFRSLYRAPDRHALLITDGSDGTPISFASDSKLMLYDPLKGCVFYSPKASTGTTIRVENGIFRYGWRQSVWSDDPSSIRLDVKSMLSGPSRRDEVVKTGEGKYRLTRTSNSGNIYLFYIDTSSENPFQKIELVMGQTNRVRFCLDKIVIDGFLGDEEFAFPSKERLAEKIEVREWSSEGLLEAISISASITRIDYARLAVYQPEVRDSPTLLNLFGLSKIDWEAVRKNDEKFSQAIKDLVLPRPKNP